MYPQRVSPATSKRSNAPDSNQNPSEIQAKPFSRKPNAGAGQVAAPAHAARAAQAANTPLKPLATELRHACAELQQKLIESGVHNPAYLGLIEGGGLAYMNPETKDVGIRQLRVKPSAYGNLANHSMHCLVKADGRVMLNGKTLTDNDPDLPKVGVALTRMLNEVLNDGLWRNSVLGGNLLTPPWDFFHRY